MRVVFRALLLKVAVFLSVLFCSSGPLHAQSMTLSISSEDFVVSTVFSDVRVFDFSIEIDEPLAVGVYENPVITRVTYQVEGDLAAGTPSAFPAFALEREITGDEFYAQGSTLQFEISADAVLDDGVQVVELAGNDLVFLFDGREIGTGRFHPALFELRADSAGRIQNSNNMPTLEPPLEIEFGAEYITDLSFDPGNTTLITGPVNVVENGSSSSSIGAFGLVGLCGLCLFGSIVLLRR